MWHYFGFKTDEKGIILNKKEVICQKCDQKLLYSGNIMNLTYHLKHCHKEEYTLRCKTQTALPTSPKPWKEQIQIDYFTKGLYT